MTGSTAAGAGAGTEWRRHWPVVIAAASGVALSTLMSYCLALFIEPLEQEFGWTRAQITSGQIIASTCAVLFGPFVGGLIDLAGPRRMGILAGFAMIGATMLLSLTTADVWVWRGLWIPVSLAIVLIQPTVWTSAVTQVFNKGRGLALAVTLCGSSLASVVTPLLTYTLIEEFGWRMAFVLLPAIWGAIVMPVVFLAFRTPRDAAVRTAGTPAPRFASNTGKALRKVVLTRRFITFALAGLAFAAVTVTLAISSVPILTAFGLDRAEATGVASLLGLASIVGRLSIGLILDRWPARLVAATCSCLPLIGVAILLGAEPGLAAAVATVLVFGLTLGAELDILAYLTSRYFPAENFGFLFGIIGGLVTLAGGVGPVALNAVFDATQAYTLALWAMIAPCLMAMLLFLTLGPYPESEAA